MTSANYGTELGRIMSESLIKGILSALIHFAPYFIALLLLAIVAKWAESAITKAIYKKKAKYSDKKAVMKEISSFETSAVKETIEMACVITIVGEVYQCFGVEDRVFPDFDLKEKLLGATISHNHPIEETAFTFSTDDLNLFMSYNLELLRGCDEKYTYEFTRDASNIDEEPEEWMTFENFEHSRIIEKAKEFNIGYRRWLNE